MMAKKKANSSEFMVKALIHILLIIFAIIVLIPFYWMFTCSFKMPADFYAGMKTLFPERPVIGNYVDLFTTSQFPLWICNSFAVSILSVAIGTIICSMAGFAFGVYNFRFKKLLFWTVLCSVAIPEIVTIIPIFKIMAAIKLIDTYAALVLPYAVSMFGIFMMKQYISTSLPRDLIEAARIDGLSEFGIYFKIAMPLIKPGLGALGIYLWLNSWDGYFWPLIMLKSQSMLTLPLGLATLYSNPWNLEYGMLMAGSVVSTLPIIIVFLLAQEQFISGLTTGAVKG